MGLLEALGRLGGRLLPIWRHSSVVLAADSSSVAAGPRDEAMAGPYRAAADPVAERERRLTALVYSGQREVAGGHMFVLRRVALDGEGKLRVVWEEGAPEPGVLVPERYGRVGDLVILPLGLGGVRAVDVRTGAQRWVQPYSAPMAAPPELAPDDTIVVRFVDGYWMRLDAATAHVRDYGVGPGAPGGRRLIDVRPLDEAPVGERLTWHSGPDGRDALGVIEPGGDTRWVLVVDTRSAVCRFDGCYAVDGLFAVRISILEPGATIGRRSTYLCDPRTWSVLARLPGADASTSEIYAPRWMGRL